MRPSSAVLLPALLASAFAFSPVAFAVEAADDTTPPAVDIDFPAPDAIVVDDRGPTFAGSAGTADGDAPTVTVEIFVGPTATGTPRESLVRPVVDGAWSTKAETDLFEGEFTLRIRQQDGAGNVGIAVASFWIDTSTPVPVIAEPANPATADATPAFRGWAGTNPGDAETVTVEIFAGSVASGTPIQSQTVGTDGEWQTAAFSELPDGEYTLRVSQADDAGHTGTDTVGFRVDTTAPALTITAPSGDTNRRSMSGAAGTATGDADKVTVELFAGPEVAGDPVFTATDTVSIGLWQVSAPALTEGTYTMRVTQSDAVGNITTLAQAFRLDLTAPVAVLETPVAGAQLTDGMPLFSGTAGSAPGDAPTVTVDIAMLGYANRYVLRPEVVGGRFAARPLRPLANGTYTVTVSQSDAARNRTASESRTFTVSVPRRAAPPVPDARAPSVELPSRVRLRDGRVLAVLFIDEEDATATVSLRLGKLVLATGRLSTGGHAVVRLKPRRGALKRLRRSRRRPTLTVRAVDASGNATLRTRAVRVSRR